MIHNGISNNGFKYFTNLASQADRAVVGSLMFVAGLMYGSHVSSCFPGIRKSNGLMWSLVSNRTQCSGHYFSYFISMTLLATFNSIFVCLQTIASCTVLLDLRMIPVSCKMIYLLYLDGQKLGRWCLILRSATYCLSLVNVTSLLLFTTLEQMC